MTPDLIEKMDRCERQFVSVLTEHQAHQFELEHAEHAYRQAHATAMTIAEGTESVKKAKADKATNAEMLRRNKARAALKTTEAALRYWLEEKRTITALIYSERADREMAH